MFISIKMCVCEYTAEVFMFEEIGSNVGDRVSDNIGAVYQFDGTTQDLGTNLVGNAGDRFMLSQSETSLGSGVSRIALSFGAFDSQGGNTIFNSSGSLSSGGNAYQGIQVNLGVNGTIVPPNFTIGNGLNAQGDFEILQVTRRFVDVNGAAFGSSVSDGSGFLDSSNNQIVVGLATQFIGSVDLVHRVEIEIDVRSTAVPEPCALGFIALSSLILLQKRRR